MNITTHHGLFSDGLHVLLWQPEESYIFKHQQPLREPINLWMESDAFCDFRAYQIRVPHDAFI